MSHFDGGVFSREGLRRTNAQFPDQRLSRIEVLLGGVIDFLDEMYPQEPVPKVSNNVDPSAFVPASQIEGVKIEGVKIEGDRAEPGPEPVDPRLRYEIIQTLLGQSLTPEERKVLRQQLADLAGVSFSAKSVEEQLGEAERKGIQKAVEHLKECGLNGSAVRLERDLL